MALLRAPKSFSNSYISKLIAELSPGRQFIRLQDKSYREDEEFYDKLLLDPMVRAAAETMGAEVAGTEWFLTSDNDQDLIPIYRDAIKQIKGFLASRVVMAKNAVLRGLSVHQMQWKRKFMRLGNDKKPRSWVVPTRILDIGLDRIRQSAEIQIGTIKPVFRWNVWDQADMSWKILSPVDELDYIWSVYLPEESALGYGNGIGKALYYLYRLKVVLLELIAGAAERFVDSWIILKLEHLSSTDNFYDDTDTIDQVIEQVEKMRSHGIMAVTGESDVQTLTPSGTQWQMMTEMLDKIDRKILVLVKGSNLDMEITGGGSFAAANVQAEVSNKRLFVQRETVMAEPLTDWLLPAFFRFNQPIFRAMGRSMHELPKFNVSGGEIFNPAERLPIFQMAIENGIKVSEKSFREQLSIPPVEPGEPVLETQPQEQGGGFPGFVISEGSEKFANKWITIGGKEDEDGKKINKGTRILIDENGNIVAGGPKEWRGKNVKQTSKKAKEKDLGRDGGLSDLDEDDLKAMTKKGLRDLASSEGLDIFGGTKSGLIEGLIKEKQKRETTGKQEKEPSLSEMSKEDLNMMDKSELRQTAKKEGIELFGGSRKSMVSQLIKEKESREKQDSPEEKKESAKKGSIEEIASRRPSLIEDPIILIDKISQADTPERITVHLVDLKSIRGSEKRQAVNAAMGRVEQIVDEEKAKEIKELWQKKGLLGGGGFPPFTASTNPEKFAQPAVKRELKDEKEEFDNVPAELQDAIDRFAVKKARFLMGENIDMEEARADFADSIRKIQAFFDAEGQKDLMRKAGGPNPEKKPEPAAFADRWITIGGSPDEEDEDGRKGGKKVKIDGKGNIVAGGPKKWRGKHISQTATSEKNKRIREMAKTHPEGSPLKRKGGRPIGDPSAASAHNTPERMAGALSEAEQHGNNPDHWGSSSQTYFRPGPNPTVDNVITRDGPDGKKQILLIQRGEGTAEGGKWALPGGFHDSEVGKGEFWKPGKETAQDAALRELTEETGLDASAVKNQMEHVGFFDKAGRDPRDNDGAWAVSNGFKLHLGPEFDAQKVQGMDDAQDAQWTNVSDLGGLDMAFDHSDIIKKAKI